MRNCGKQLVAKTRFHDMTTNILILLPCVEGGMKGQMDTRK